MAAEPFELNRDRRQVSSDEALARLGAQVLDAHRRLVEARRQNARAVAAVAAEADRAVARILAAAILEARTDPTPSVDDMEAGDIVIVQLDQALETDRAQLAKELEHARADAEARVLAARAEAVRLVGGSADGGRRSLTLIPGDADRDDGPGEPGAAAEGSIPDDETRARTAPVVPVACPAPAATTAPAPRPPRRGARRYLHVDIILPMVAVVIVLVVLVAWVG